MKKVNNKKGFTIVELVIVIAVIAILAAVLIPTFSGVVEKANKTAALEKAKNALTAVLTANDGKLDGDYYFVVVDSSKDGYWFDYNGGALKEGSKSTPTFSANDVIYVGSSVKSGNSIDENFNTALEKELGAKVVLSSGSANGYTFKDAKVSFVPDVASGVVIIPKKSAATTTAPAAGNEGGN